MPNTKTNRSICIREWKKVIKHLELALTATKAADDAVNHETDLFKKALPAFVTSVSGALDFAKAIQTEI